MGDVGDFWRDVNAARQEKRRSNRTGSPQLLTEAGIPFESKNGGAHLIVRANGAVIDFWPGTGLWIVRGSTQRHGGVRSLIALCKGI
jgi:hypothetical protein